MTDIINKDLLNHTKLVIIYIYICMISIYYILEINLYYIWMSTLIIIVKGVGTNKRAYDYNILLI